jgi:hypothetical protein
MEIQQKNYIWTYRAAWEVEVLAKVDTIVRGAEAAIAYTPNAVHCTINLFFVNKYFIKRVNASSLKNDTNFTVFSEKDTKMLCFQGLVINVGFVLSEIA